MTNSDEVVELKKEKPIFLIGNNVILRSWQLEDKQSLIENTSNYKVAINLRNQFPYPYTNNDADEWLSFVTTLTFSSSLYLAIEVENQAVGGISIGFDKDIHRCTAELGY